MFFKGHFWFGLCGLVLLLGSFRESSAAADSIFDQANRAFEQGKYQDAIVGYKKLVDQKQISAAVFFNLGNAYFKNGQPGEAIAYYHLAQQISPRDPDIRANLRFARESVGAQAVETGRWYRFISVFTLNELAVAAASLLWLTCLLLVLGLLRPEWKSSLRFYRNCCLMLTIVSGVWLGIVAETRLAVDPAVVVSRQAVVRYGPFEESQGFYTLRDGVELSVLDHKEDWLQVRDPSHRVGWLLSKDVLVLPRG
jgi:hypothetical protein